MKKIFLNSLVMLVAATLGLTVGFALRNRMASDATSESKASHATTSDSRAKALPTSRQHNSVPRHDDSPLATKLERDLSMSTGVTRWLYWLEAMENASASDFPRLARLAESNAAAMRLVSQRWIELYPRHLFDTVVDATKNGRALTKGMLELSRTLFNEWPKRDPDSAIAALNDPDDFAMRSSWRQSVADTVIEKDVERGLQLFSEWHIENFTPRMNGVTKWAAADPRHAAEFALANPGGHVSQAAMETIGKEWAKTDPIRALEFAADHPGDLGSILATTALKEWSGKNLQGAADWLATVDVKTRNRLSPAFVEAWAKQDANSALTWCELNLSGSSLAQAVGGVLRGAAEKDVTAAAKLVGELNPSQARAEAAAAVAKKWFSDDFKSDKPIDPAAISWLATLDAESARRAVNDIVWRWAGSDPKSMAAFLASSSERFSEHAYNILACEIARKNPVEAIEWASRLPEDRGLSAGAGAFAEWRRSQPEAATKWFNDLPLIDPRRQPYFQGAVRSLAWDPQCAEQLAALTGPERAVARSTIETMKLPNDHRTRLLEMLKP